MRGRGGYIHVCVRVRVCVCVCVCVCVWDEFLESLLETRVLVSADFNKYPIRIFYIVPCDNFGIFRLELIPLKIAIYQIYDIS